MLNLTFWRATFDHLLPFLVAFHLNSFFSPPLLEIPLTPLFHFNSFLGFCSISNTQPKKEFKCCDLMKKKCRDGPVTKNTIFTWKNSFSIILLLLLFSSTFLGIFLIFETLLGSFFSFHLLSAASRLNNQRIEHRPEIIHPLNVEQNQNLNEKPTFLFPYGKFTLLFDITVTLLCLLFLKLLFFLFIYVVYSLIFLFCPEFLGKMSRNNLEKGFELFEHSFQF